MGCGGEIEVFFFSITFEEFFFSYVTDLVGRFWPMWGSRPGAGSFVMAKGGMLILGRVVRFAPDGGVGFGDVGVEFCVWGLGRAITFDRSCVAVVFFTFILYVCASHSYVRQDGVRVFL